MKSAPQNNMSSNGRELAKEQPSLNRLQGWQSQKIGVLNPFICGTICWLHSVGNGYTKSTENCGVARHRNQIKPDALKVTNAPKCESQADVHGQLEGSLIYGAFMENVTLPSLWNIDDNGPASSLWPGEPASKTEDKPRKTETAKVKKKKMQKQELYYQCMCMDLWKVERTLHRSIFLLLLQYWKWRK